MDGSRAHSARAIARRPEAVAQVIAEAKENEDIPTKTAVLDRIALEKERKRRKRRPHLTACIFGAIIGAGYRTALRFQRQEAGSGGRE